jgi:hypothetical protein
MLIMFGVLAVLFYIDGSTGYRKKNENFFLNKTFQKANSDFSQMNSDGKLSPVEWKAYAANQSVEFPKDRSVLPASIQLPMAWPPILHDYEKMKPLQWNILWREYTKDRGMDESPPEEPFDAQKIASQWVVFYICSGFCLVAAFFLFRTLGRSISADEASIRTQRGLRVLFTDLKSIDLRKWDTKGLAFISYQKATGMGQIRIDGLTYGGFKKENGEPAERLMQHIRSHFSGEIIEYTTVSSIESPSGPSSPV